MKYLLSLFALLFCTTLSYAQYEYEPSTSHPFGQLNPKAPSEVGDFAPLIGESDCLSESRNQDGTWAEPMPMIWRWKYIMNGMAVQDETLKPDGIHSGSIRQFNADSAAWYVHYYSSSSAVPILPAWEGGKTDEQTITLYREQTAPNGIDGFFKIDFTDMTDDSFNWLGAWVSVDESFSYPTWKISCTKKD
ncbi:MAG: hypothetical protein JJ895_15125 [Balneolaceae bacterium]|nr:hypothetical protein [Balneolaceae bacterium]